MKKILLPFFFLFSVSSFSQTFTTSTVVQIPDNGPEVFDSLVVSGLPASIDSAFGLSGLCFAITHTYVGDLEIRLKSPNGNTIFIANRIGGNGHNFTGTCLAENGANGFLANGSAPFTGSWIPLESLNQLNNGQNPNGVWKFMVQDQANVDTGNVHVFSLTFGTNPPADPGPPPILCSFCDCPNGLPPPCDLLPDMTSSARSISKDIDTVTHYSTKETPGNLNFDNATPNIGWGPLEIIGVDSCYCGTTLVPCSTANCPGNVPVKQIVNQVVYHKPNVSDTLTSYTRKAGYMSYHSGHGHIHVDNWAAFSLRTPTANTDATTWPIVGTGTKTSFCLVNLGDCDAEPGYCVDTAGTALSQADIHNAGFGFYTGCTLHQGIYVGKLDIYVAGLNTGIDLTGVCNGDYYIVSITDPDSNMLETNESNNWAAVPVSLHLQNPTADFNSVINGIQTTVLATNLVNATSYTWDFGDGTGTVSDSSPVTHNYATTGNYIITLTVNSPCGAGIFSHTDSINLTTVGINQVSSADVSMNPVPNPSKDMMDINYYLSKSDHIQIELFDIVGKKIETIVSKDEILGSHVIKLNPREKGINAGTYFLKLSTKGNSLTKIIEIIN